MKILWAFMYDEAKSKGKKWKKVCRRYIIERSWMWDDMDAYNIRICVYTCTFILSAYNLIIEICFLSVIDTLDISFNIGEREFEALTGWKWVCWGFWVGEGLERILKGLKGCWREFWTLCCQSLIILLKRGFGPSGYSDSEPL